MVTERMLSNALEMSVDEAANPNNINKKELIDIKKRFNGLIDKLMEEAEDEEDEN